MHNHKTSKQNDDVVKRLETILNAGDYDSAKESLKEIGLGSEKRNCNVLKPESQSSTIMTIADDYIHYSNPRALTVREMARLQSFDDSFVFQGEYISVKEPKWEINKTPMEQVLNSTPPLFARAIGMLLLNAL